MRVELIVLFSFLGLISCTLELLSSQNRQLQFSRVSSFLKSLLINGLPNCEILITFHHNPLLQSTHPNHEGFLLRQALLLSQVFKDVGEAGYEQGAGIYLLNTARNVTSPRRFEDIHRLAIDGSCGVNVLLLKEDYDVDKDCGSLFTLLTPRYEPITRKDEDYFIFVTPNDTLAQEVLVSHEFGNKIKFKLALVPGEQEPFKMLTANVYGNNGEPFVLQLNVSENIFTKSNLDREEKGAEVFPDFTKNLHGKALRMSVANVPFRITLERRSDGRLHPKRGFHTIWLGEAMAKFNFTYDMFVSSLGGGTGKQFPNGSWGGSVGDILYGKADIAFQVAHIYNRHRFVEWAAPFTYEAIIFIVHQPRTYFSPNAIFWPFTPPMWVFFLISLVTSAITFKYLAVAYVKIRDHGKATDDNSWSNGRVSEYIIATFLEQDRGGPSHLPFHPIRIFCAFWLLFAFITGTTYRAKLTTLMAFPLKSVVPETFEELVDSDFNGGLNVVGKGDAAYTIFSTGKGRVYEGMFAKMGIYPDAVECILKSVNEDFCCMIWDGYAEYINAKNVTDRNGRSPLQASITKTSFIEDGLVFEKRSIFRKHFDQTIRNSVNMGLSKQWLKMDLNAVELHRRQWERAVNKPAANYATITGPVKLKLAQFAGSFMIWAGGIFIAFLAFLRESSTSKLFSVTQRTRRGEPNRVPRLVLSAAVSSK